ncbi:MAG: hypothetical protein KJI69_03745 [Patescibacteria group bacterium]|nr:hypothetical protein [Patescibacteria group bacterium]
MEKGKFHPHTDYKKGTRMSRDQNAKTQGTKIRKQRLTVASSPKGLKTPTEIVSNPSGNADDGSLHRVIDVVAEPMITRRIPSNIYVNLINMEEATGDDFEPDKKYVAEVILMPQWRYIHPKIKEDVASQNAWTVKELEENTGAGKDGFSWVADVMSSYGGIRLGSDESGADPKELVQRLADKAPAYAGMIGFFLDSAWNGMGNTGWDSLKMLTKNKPLPAFGKSR